MKLIGCKYIRNQLVSQIYFQFFLFPKNYIAVLTYFISLQAGRWPLLALALYLKKIQQKRYYYTKNMSLIVNKLSSVKFY